MTTDITELAQREKFEAWFKSSFHPDKTGPYIKDQLYFAWKAAGAELVEALEKAQRANAAQDDHINQQQYRIGLVEKIGTERVEALENNNTPHRYTIEELEGIRRHYSALRRALIKQREAA